jgi:CRISPR-associated protein Csm5
MSHDVVWNLVAIPLTPIHVGDGSVLTPETYDLDADALLRFSPSAVLHSMAADRRALWSAALDRGDLKAAWRVIRGARRPEHVLERIGVGPAARAEIGKLLDSDDRAGEIRPMLRSGSTKLVPGSSIKGALRTALLSHRVVGHEAEIEADKARARSPKGELSGAASDDVQRGLLGHRSTDEDPFRFVGVSDLVMPVDSTRVDRVINWRPSRLLPGGAQPAEKMQMLVERLRAASDGPDVPLAEITIAVAAGRLERSQRLDGDRRKTPSRPIAPAELIEAARTFHWTLFDQERNRFYADEPGIRAALDAAFRVRLADGTVLDERGLRARPDMILLRVGRFGQFESKSLAGVREGWNPQAHPPRAMTVGNTRNLVRTADHAPLVPFGWLLLAPPGTRSAAGRWRLDGEEVEELSRDADGVTVRFANGDIDTVPPDELEPIG